MAATTVTRGESTTAIIVKELRKNKAALACATLLILIVLVAIFAPYIAPRDPNRPNIPARFSPPSAEYWFGTDHYGRDILSRTIYGTRVSLTVGVVAVGFGAFFGIILGLVAGYRGGLLDNITMRLIDIMLAFPLLLLALTLIAVLGSNVINVILATGISTIPQFARVVRASVLTVKENDYIHANRALGASQFRTMVWHVLPNVAAPIIVMATIYTATVIILEANLGFLGFGVQPPEASWGSIVNDGRRYLSQAPWVSIFPSVAITITVLSLNIFGDGLRDAMDPRLRK